MTDTNHDGFTLQEELILMRDQIRRFMREEVKPIEDKLPHDATCCSQEDLGHLRAIADAMGLTNMSVPEEYGGNPASALTQIIVAEESAKCRLGAYAPVLNAFKGGPPNIIWAGTTVQKEKYGVPCVGGRANMFVAITESTGGSDPRKNITTRAEKRGDKWYLNGQKNVDYQCWFGDFRNFVC
jgi:acyl-CoA dehydrogenase